MASCKQELSPLQAAALLWEPEFHSYVVLLQQDDICSNLSTTNYILKQTMKQLNLITTVHQDKQLKA